MAYTYTPSNITNKDHMNFSSWSLQFAHALIHVSSIFASTFLVSYIMNINVDEPINKTIISIALFFIAQYVTMFCLISLFSWIVDSTNRVWIYRLGVLLNGAFVVMILFVGKDLAKYSTLAGFIYGLAQTLYYAAYNVMKCEVIPKAHADRFIVWESVLNRFIKISFPVIIGAIIDVSSYGYTSILVLVIVAIQLLFSFFVKCYKPDGSKFQLFSYIKLMKERGAYKRIKNVYLVALSYGGTAIHTSLVSLLAIYTFKTNLNLGIFTALASLVAVLIVALFKRFTKLGKRIPWLVIFGFLPVAISIVVAIFINKTTFILFSIIMEISACVFSYCFEIQRITILKKSGLYEYIAEHQTMNELCINFVRIVTFCLMLVLGVTLGMLGIKILIGIVSITYPALCLAVSRQERAELRSLETTN